MCLGRFARYNGGATRSSNVGRVLAIVHDGPPPGILNHLVVQKAILVTHPFYASCQVAILAYPFDKPILPPFWSEAPRGQFTTCLEKVTISGVRGHTKVLNSV